MKSALEVLKFEEIRCTGDNFITESGIKFINHINKNQPLRYLHKIFPGIKFHEFKIVEQHLGFNPSNSYRDFILEFGGAILFDRNMHIYGYDSAISRSLDLDRQKPVYIGQAYKDFKSIYPELALQLWAPIGSVALNRQIWVAMNQAGEIKVINGDTELNLKSFDEWMNLAVPTLASACGCGPIDESEIDVIESVLLCVRS